MPTSRLPYISAKVLQDLTIPIGRRRARILPMVVSIASSQYRKVQSYVDYEDVVAAALLGAATADKKFRKHSSNGAKYSTYAYGVIQGAAKDEIRRAITNLKKHVLHDPNDMPVSLVHPTVESDLTVKQLFDIAIGIIHRSLPNRHAAILLMFYLQDKSAEQIAQSIKKSVALVNKDKQAALAHVRNEMQKRGHHGLGK